MGDAKSEGEVEPDKRRMNSDNENGDSNNQDSENIEDEHLEPETGDSDEADAAEHQPQPTPATHEFRVGDVVLAFHGSLLYEANILKIVQSEHTESYVVHYLGWQMSWDDTVPRDRIFVHNDVNLLVAHELLRHAKSRQKRASPATGELTSKTPGKASSDRAAAKKRSASDALQLDESIASSSAKGRGPNGGVASSTDPATLFELPASLKRQLVDDWEFVTKEHKLVSLPREYTVRRIMAEWLRNRRAGQDRASREVAESLQEYFDAMLPTVLLYRFERHQFRDFFDDENADSDVRTPSSVYGAEHLLRLFVKLPYMLQQANVDPKMMKMIGERVNELARYIQKNGRDFILADYVPATPQYIAGRERGN